MDDEPTRRSDSEGREREKRRSTRPWKPNVPRVIRDWWVEIAVGLLILFAAFLLLERMDIRQSLLAAVRGLLAGLSSLLGTGAGLVIGFIRGTSPSDLVAYALIIAVVGVVAWRLRWRLVSSPRLTKQACPKCDSELRRIRRRGRDRLLDIYIPVRRYQCSNRDCRWRGLRVHRSRDE